MPESGAGKPEGIIEKTFRGLFRTKTQKEADKKWTEVEDSFNQALAAHDYDKLYRITANALPEVDGANTIKMIRMVMDLINQDCESSNTKVANLPFLLHRTIDFLILSADIKTNDESALKELIDREIFAMSSVLDSKLVFSAFYQNELCTEVKAGSKRIIDREVKSVFGAIKGDLSTRVSNRVSPFLEGGLKALKNYRKEKEEQIEGSFTTYEGHNNVYSMYGEFQNYVSWTDEKDSTRLRDMVTRAAKVLERNANGQFPKQKYDYALKEVVEGATGFLLAALKFNYHRSASEFQLFKNISDGFSHVLESPHRADIVPGPLLKETVGKSQGKIGQALGEVTKRAADKEGFNEEIAKRLLIHIQNLKIAGGSSVENPMTRKMKEALGTAVTQKNLFGVLQVVNEATQFRGEAEKALVAEAAGKGLQLFVEETVKLKSIKTGDEITTLVLFGGEFLGLTSGYYDNNMGLEKRWDQMFFAFENLLDRAIWENCPLSQNLKKTINDSILRFGQMGQLSLDRGKSDVTVRCNKAILALERFRKQLYAPRLVNPNPDIWASRPLDIQKGPAILPNLSGIDRRVKLTTNTTGSERVPVPMTGVLPERRIGDTLEMLDGSKFRILKISSGGQFIVYQAEDDRGKKVCLRTERRDLGEEDKIRSDQIAVSIGIVQELRRDAPSVVNGRMMAPYGIHFDNEGNWYLKSAWCEGTCLQEVMDQRTTMREEETERIIKKLVELLVYMGDKKVSHRDIKPSNVILTPDGETVLIDFDIVLKLSENGKAVNSDSHGTSEYAGKEQFGPDGKTMITTTTDCHALGVMIYEMLTGEGQALNEKGDPLLMEDKVEIRFSKIRNLPPKWQEIVENCTFHQSDRRWTARQVLERLNRREPFSL